VVKPRRSKMFAALKLSAHKELLGRQPDSSEKRRVQIPRGVMLLRQTDLEDTTGGKVNINRNSRLRTAQSPTGGSLTICSKNFIWTSKLNIYPTNVRNSSPDPEVLAFSPRGLCGAITGVRGN